MVVALSLTFYLREGITTKSLVDLRTLALANCNKGSIIANMLTLIFWAGRQVANQLTPYIRTILILMVSNIWFMSLILTAWLP